MISRIFFGVFSILALSFSAQAVTSVEVHHGWGKLGTVYQYGRYYAAAAPDEEAIQEFKKEKGGLVIDVRGIQELDCSSRTAATQAGIAYRNVPLDTQAGIPADAIALVEKTLDESNSSQPVLVACKTGNRAAAVLAIHIARQEHLSAKQTLQRAESLGMKSPELKKKLKQFLHAHPEAILPLAAS